MDQTPDLDFYYAIHRHQREDLRRLADAVRTATEADRRGRLRPLAKWARGFSNELRTHHTVEDQVFFPAVVERVPSASRLVEDLDADHHQLDPMIDRLASGIAELADPQVPFEPVHAEMTELTAGLSEFLHRHLDVEDQDLLPLFCRHFSAAEYDALHERAQKSLPKTGLAFAVPWNVEALDEAGKEKILTKAPLSLRLLYRATRRSHSRLVAAAFDTESTKRMRNGGSVSITIAAPSEAIYDVVSDITRTGEWSDETGRVEWSSSDRGAGARFKGWNRVGAFRWTRHCEVLVADRGRTFAFRTIPGKSPTKRDSTMWRFDLTPEAGGTRVVQSYELLKLPPRWFVPVIGRTAPHHFDMRPHMAECLERLRVLVESSAPSTSTSELITARSNA
jgi:hemerythrin-like domain-containing protein